MSLDSMFMQEAVTVGSGVCMERKRKKHPLVLLRLNLGLSLTRHAWANGTWLSSYESSTLLADVNRHPTETMRLVRFKISA